MNRNTLHLQQIVKSLKKTELFIAIAVRHSEKIMIGSATVFTDGKTEKAF